MFKKVKDNTIRTILCTLIKGVIPSQFEKAVNTIYAQIPENPDIIPMWDIEEGKWKSFKLSKMIEFRDSEEIKNVDKPGHKIKSRGSDLIEEIKNKATQNYQDRIKNQLEESRRIKNTMKG